MKLSSRQEGAVLLVALVMLLLITLIATASIRETALQSRISGSVSERKQASNAAEAALREGERRLLNHPTASEGYADCGVSTENLNTNLCILGTDRFKTNSVAGSNWWAIGSKYAIDYKGSSDTYPASFSSGPRWNAAYMGQESIDASGYSYDNTSPVTYYYRVTSMAYPNEQKRFPVILQSVISVER
ncbi:MULTISPECIES: pilus assembly PilX family protein [Pseudomonas]|uniref:pilus assembly PilX family protein n=1 Tax=Pseudomonas TaxID=286 RepID=UPI000EFCE301|nr:MULTISPECIES: PilX N-terminal domain-containing pilus assembly protein [Pseudomonas]AYN95623.1 hypothetical protein EAW52_17480 [Pseudomonas sp. LTJR-52]